MKNKNSYVTLLLHSFAAAASHYFAVNYVF